MIPAADTGRSSISVELPPGSTLAETRSVSRDITDLLRDIPEVEELPLLSAFYTENKANGLQLVGLAIDKAEPVSRFLARSPVSFPVALAGMEGVELTRELGNAAGGLPFSVLFDAGGRLRERKLGQLHEADLTAWRAGLQT